MRISTLATLLLVIFVAAGATILPFALPFVPAQMHSAMQEPQELPFDLDPTPLPPLTLDFAKMIEILAEYDVIHENKVMTATQLYGLTSPEMHTIFVNTEADAFTKRVTILHEFLHAAYAQQGFRTSGPHWERLIDAKANEICQSLFGVRGN